MTNNTQNLKSFPVSTSEVAQMLGMPLDVKPKNGLEETIQTASNFEKKEAKPEGFSQIAANLDVKSSGQPSTHPSIKAQSGTSAGQEHASSGVHAGLDLHMESIKKNIIFSNLFQALKAITPYVLVFSVALFVYFYFFGNASINFPKIFSSQPKAVASVKEASLAQLQNQNLSGYYQWINQFYYDVSDTSVLDPNVDNSGNGLSNFQKYLLNLNPKAYDTLGLGVSDSEELNQGINPLTDAALTDAQKTVVDKYFDMEVVMNRLALAQMKKHGEVAGVQMVSASNYGFGQQSVQTAGLSVRGNVMPAATVNAAAPVKQPSNPVVQINGSEPGRLQIPSLKIDVPLIWSTDSKNFDKDLQSGVIHYPGTAMPGEIGTTYISGHSSNYVWVKGSYNQIFSHLDSLADDASFSITVKTADGHTSVFHYVVVGRQQYSATDQAQFKNSGQSVVALSTCWPVGSTKYRYVVFGQLTQVEQQ